MSALTDAGGAQDWVLWGCRPLYGAEIAEIVARCGGRLRHEVDNLAPGPDAVTGTRGEALSMAEAARIDRALAVVLAAGPPGIRQLLAAEARALGFDRFPALIDPTAVVAASARLGEGVTVNALAVVAANTAIGRFAQVNRSASIGHDVVLDDFVTIGPAAVLTGSVHVEPGAFIGAGSVTVPGITIGANSTVGAGAVVTRDVPPFTVVAGNPARPLRQTETGYAGFTVDAR